MDLIMSRMFVQWIVVPNFVLQIAHTEYCLEELATDPESIPTGSAFVFGARVKHLWKTGPGSGVSFIFGSNRSLHDLYKRHSISTK